MSDNQSASQNIYHF